MASASDRPLDTLAKFRAPNITTDAARVAIAAYLLTTRSTSCLICGDDGPASVPIRSACRECLRIVRDGGASWWMLVKHVGAPHIRNDEVPLMPFDRLVAVVACHLHGLPLAWGACGDP